MNMTLGEIADQVVELTREKLETEHQEMKNDLQAEKILRRQLEERLADALSRTKTLERLTQNQGAELIKNREECAEINRLLKTIPEDSLIPHTVKQVKRLTETLQPILEWERDQEKPFFQYQKDKGIGVGKTAPASEEPDEMT